MNPKNIYLIGARATGKTTVAARLAQETAMEFIDLDELISRRQSKSIKEIVAAEGWQFFRAKERQVLDEISQGQGLVVATGGGAVLHEDIWPQVMASGVVIWLTAEVETIRRRLTADSKTASQRPSLSGADPVAEALETLRQRTPLYQQGCHFSVAAEESPEIIVSNIIRRLTAS